MTTSVSNTQKSPVLTHSLAPTPLEEKVEQLKKKIKERGSLSYSTETEQLQLLEDFSKFPMGQFLIQNGGLNGFWTDYILLHPNKGRLSGVNSEGKPFSRLEKLLLDQAPTFLATQERFAIFKKKIQERLYEGATLASVPCGSMSDLLNLDFSMVKQFQLIGVDIDPEATKLAERNIPNQNLLKHISFQVEDAWKLKLPRKADLITSNGLNIYEKKNQRVVELYTRFFENLKPGGVLVTSYLTPPPAPGTQSEWVLGKIDQEAARIQKVLFADILDSTWRSFRSTELTIKQLKEAGFEEINIFRDSASIFPTVVARRPI